MKLTFTLFTFFLSSFIVGQSVQDTIVNTSENKSEGKLITITPFKGIKLYSGIHLKLIPSTEDKLIIYGNDSEYLITTLKKDILRIKYSLKELFKPRNTYIELYFSNPLELIHAYQGSIIESDKLIKNTAIEFKIREGAKLDLEINAEKITSSVNSGGTLILCGESVNHNLRILGGGICESEKLKTKQTTVKVTAGGVAYLHASDLLEAIVNIGGTVRIYGSPTRLVKSKRIGGTIKEMN